MSSLPPALAKTDPEHARQRIQNMLANDESMSMVFQPVVDLQTEEVVGTEALARFTSQPDRGPAAWFQEAARAGLLADLEIAAIRKALASCDRLPPNIRLHINASPTTLATADLTAVIPESIANRLVLEVSAEAMVSYRLLEKGLENLRSRGTHLAVDDAGRGSASLWHLAKLHPEVIKLDASITRAISSDPQARAVARGLIAFSDESEAIVIAEAIETESERRELQKLGVRYGQGYLFGFPAALL